MKRFAIIFILFLGIGTIPAKADTIATNVFNINAPNEITVVTSGNLTSHINGMNGHLDTPLSVNFKITTNNDVSDIRLKALVKDSTNATYSGFYCTSNSVVASQDMFLVMVDADDIAGNTSINDCKIAASTCANNENAIAYPGTVVINNTGTIQYQDNSGEGYFSAVVKSGTTDLNMNIATTPKNGTFNNESEKADEPDFYEVQVYLDNIPG